MTRSPILITLSCALQLPFLVIPGTAYAQNRCEFLNEAGSVELRRYGHLSLGSGELSYESRWQRLGSQMSYVWGITSNSTDTLVEINWRSASTGESYFANKVPGAIRSPRCVVEPGSRPAELAEGLFAYRRSFTPWEIHRPETVTRPVASLGASTTRLTDDILGLLVSTAHAQQPDDAFTRIVADFESGAMPTVLRDHFDETTGFDMEQLAADSEGLRAYLREDYSPEIRESFAVIDLPNSNAALESHFAQEAIDSRQLSPIYLSVTTELSENGENISVEYTVSSRILSIEGETTDADPSEFASLPYMLEISADIAIDPQPTEEFGELSLAEIWGRELSRNLVAFSGESFSTLPVSVYIVADEYAFRTRLFAFSLFLPR